jgi:integrase
VVPHSIRPIPAVIQNIPKLKRKEESIYKPTDHWTPEEDFIFYKYCPSVRDKCWHAVSRDTGCRPHELLRLKIKDVVVQQLENGYQIARISVNGKTGQRSVRLNNAYSRLKEWLSNGHHPYPSNPNAPFFCGVGKKSIGRRIRPNAVYAMYAHYKQVVFPKVLEDPLVPEEDKRKIRDMLKKPWNPYARRHTSATEISKVIKDPILINNYFGWSQTGKTRLKYQDYFADDTIDAMLTVMDGLPLPSQSEQNKKKNKDLLKPKQCPNCTETNTPESKFCVRCKFVLSFDLYNEKLEEKAKAAKEAEENKKTLDKVLTRMEMIEYNNQSMSKLIGDLMDRQKGYANGTITKDTKMQPMEFTLLTEKPVTETEVPNGEGKTLGDYIREQQQKNIPTINYNNNNDGDNSSSNCNYNNNSNNNNNSNTNSQTGSTEPIEQMRLVWHKSKEGEDRMRTFRKQ